jgi:ABC-type xylose transport system substrate-binding protein
MTKTKDLQAISKQITKLARQTEKLAAALGKAEKPKAKSVKTKTKAKAVAKKAPVRVGKKADTDKILRIVNRSKKGIYTATLIKKPGLARRKSATFFKGHTNKGK